MTDGAGSAGRGANAVRRVTAWRWLWRAVGGVLVLILLGVLVGGWLLRSSLPQLDGTQLVGTSGPGSDVTLERDAGGVLTVRAERWSDVAFGLGWAHAQDRFFQMDLSRRLAAGELSALLGDSLVGQDEKARVFRLRAVAREVIADASPTQREWIEAYTRGVNQGLDALAARPWEYLLLRQTPEPWRAEDSILVIQAMWWQLQYETLNNEMARHTLTTRLLERAASASDADRSAGIDSVLQFLFPRGNEWDTPNFQRLMDNPSANGGEAYSAPPVPGPDVLDLRALAPKIAGLPSQTPSLDLSDSEEIPGSNAWAVAGSYTSSGVALVAGDMHLGLRVPAVWYRARLQVGRDTASAVELNGVTLPGLPAVAAGTNGHIAWSFTNSYGDWLDVRPYACQGTRYRTATGEANFTVSRELIGVAGGDPIALEVYESPQGTLVRRDRAESAGDETCWLARWLVTERGATNLRSLELQQVTDLEAALSLAPTVGIPHQNFVLGDRTGRIAWTIIGRIPRGDLGPETPRPIDWRTREDAPMIVDPEAGRLWSANSRHVEGELERVLGNDEAAGGMHYDMGVRARQIRDGLLALPRPATPADMLAIQLDDRATLLDRWQRLLLATLDEEAVRNQAKRGELRRLAADWRGVAAVDSVSYRLVRSFRDEIRRSTWRMITGTLQAGVDSRPFPLFEGSLWRLVTEQPPHWLSAEHADWRSFLLTRIDSLIVDLERECGTLADCSWGRRNTAQVRHPLSPALGPLGRFLDMPAIPLAGDVNVPRVAGPNFGASERFAVSPGRESEGYLQLPGGQSGHPLSPFYREGFEDWAMGRPRPLLPGPTVHTLVLEAAR